MNNMKLNKKGIVAAFITLLGWSLAGVFIKLLPKLDALDIVAIRLTISLIIIFPILIFIKKNIFSYLKELSRVTTWGLGLILFFCYLLGTLAFQMAPVGEIATLMTVSPLFVILFKFIIGGDFKKIEIVGVCIALVGVLLITLNQLSFEQSGTSNKLLGDVCALLSSALFASYAICYQVLDKKAKAPSSISIAIGVFIFGSFLLAIIVYNSIETINIIQFDYLSILYLLGISVFSTAIPTISYTIASKYLSPILTTSILLLQPVLAIILALLIMNEVPSLFVYPGFVFIVIGLITIIKF